MARRYPIENRQYYLLLSECFTNIVMFYNNRGKKNTRKNKKDKKVDSQELLEWIKKFKANNSAFLKAYPSISIGDLYRSDEKGPRLFFRSDFFSDEEKKQRPVLLKLENIPILLKDRHFRKSVSLDNVQKSLDKVYRPDIHLIVLLSLLFHLDLFQCLILCLKARYEAFFEEQIWEIVGSKLKESHPDQSFYTCINSEIANKMLKVDSEIADKMLVKNRHLISFIDAFKTFKEDTSIDVLKLRLGIFFNSLKEYNSNEAFDTVILRIFTFKIYRFIDRNSQNIKENDLKGLLEETHAFVNNEINEATMLTEFSERFFQTLEDPECNLKKIVESRIKIIDPHVDLRDILLILLINFTKDTLKESINNNILLKFIDVLLLFMENKIKDNTEQNLDDILQKTKAFINKEKTDTIALNSFSEKFFQTVGNPESNIYTELNEIFQKFRTSEPKDIYEILKEYDYIPNNGVFPQEMFNDIVLDLIAKRTFLLDVFYNTPLSNARKEYIQASKEIPELNRRIEYYRKKATAALLEYETTIQYLKIEKLKGDDYIAGIEYQNKFISADDVFMQYFIRMQEILDLYYQLEVINPVKLAHLVDKYSTLRDLISNQDTTPPKLPPPPPPPPPPPEKIDETRRKVKRLLWATYPNHTPSDMPEEFPPEMKEALEIWSKELTRYLNPINFADNIDLRLTIIENNISHIYDSFHIPCLRLADQVQENFMSIIELDFFIGHYKKIKSELEAEIATLQVAIEEKKRFVNEFDTTIDRHKMAIERLDIIINEIKDILKN